VKKFPEKYSFGILKMKPRNVGQNNSLSYSLFSGQIIATGARIFVIGILRQKGVDMDPPERKNIVEMEKTRMLNG